MGSTGLNTLAASGSKLLHAIKFITRLDFVWFFVVILYLDAASNISLHKNDFLIERSQDLITYTLHSTFIIVKRYTCHHS